MILKEKNLKKYKLSINFSKKFLLLYFIITFLFLSIFTYFLLTSSQFNSYKNILFSKISKAGRYEIIYLPQIFYRGLKSKFYNFDQMNINISFENLLVIENFRQKSIENSRLGNMDEVPRVRAFIDFNGKKNTARIRLKGDRKLHWNEKKNSSYKINLSKNDFIMGIDKFSVHKPRARNYIYEWLFHKISEQEDLINLKYKFIKLSINGSDNQLYVFEENFSKELIERKNRRYGPIFSLNEDLGNNIESEILELYDEEFWLKFDNKKLTNDAADKLLKFINKEIEIEKVFDLEKWASYFAICDLLYTYHGCYSKSVRYYYNPITLLYEPIVYDGQRQGSIHPNYYSFSTDYNNQIILDYLFNHDNRYSQDNGLFWLKSFFVKKGKVNQEFYNLYVEKLSKLSSLDYLNTFFKNNENQIYKINSAIYGDYFLFFNKEYFGPGFYFFKKDDIFHRASIIRDKIIDVNLQRFKIQAIKDSNENIILKNFNDSGLYGDIRISSIECSNNIINLKNSININYINLDKEKRYVTTNLSLPEVQNLNCNKLNLINNLNQKKISINIDLLNSYGKSDSKKKKHDYTKFFKEKNNILRLIDNKIVIRSDVFIPKNKKVIIDNFSYIELLDNAVIFSYSPWIVENLKDDKQTIISGKKDNYGGGIIIYNNKEKSFFKNVKFEYLNGIDNIKNKSIIHGALNFHEADVVMKSVEFANINAEDGLNIFRSNFELNDLIFREIFSDAVDFDFSYGNLSNSKFENIGNDAIDFSGSTSNVNFVYGKNINDKFISAGEKSIVKIDNIHIEKSYAGIVSKDGSNVQVKKIQFDDVKYHYGSYIKKREYPKASMILSKFDEEYNILNDKKSSVLFDRKLVGKINKDVLKIFNERN